MSISSLFGTGRLALQANQVAMETASHNIANATVEGYSRQRVQLQPNLPFYSPYGAIGTGVVVSNVSRLRDGMLDVSYRDQNSRASGYGMRRDVLADVNSIYGEPSDTGLSAALDKFYSAWSDLANNPSNSATKSTVQQAGADVANTLNRFSSSLDTLAQNTLQSANGNISDLNRYASQIGALNNQIVAAEAGGQTANDLRDTRDTLLDKMSAIAPVRVLDHPNGSITVYVAGVAAIDGTDIRPISLSGTGSSYKLQIGAQTVAMSNADGSLGAALGTLNTDIPQAKSQLDAMASVLVSKVNSMHRTGWTAAGDALGGSNWNAAAPPTGSNVNFFDPSKVTAATITLSTAVKNDANTIAAGNVQNATSNNALANSLATLRTDTSSIAKIGSATTTSFSEYYRDAVTRSGSNGADAESSASVYETLSSQADTQRQSVSGVSTDDELIELTKRQQAYAAAAKIITTATEMSQSLLDMLPLS